MGPFWYRGYLTENNYPETTAAQIDSLLSYYKVESIVVGHTEVDSVGLFQDGRVIAVDVPVEDLGSLQGLLWEDGRYYRVAGSGRKTALK